MTDTPIRTSLAPVQGPESNPNSFERHAKALRKAGGALLLPHEMKHLSKEARSEIERLQQKTYGPLK